MSWFWGGIWWPYICGLPSPTRHPGRSEKGYYETVSFRRSTVCGAKDCSKQIDKQGGFLNRKSTWKGGFSEDIPFTREEIINAIEDGDVGDVLVFRGSIQNTARAEPCFFFFGDSIIPDRNRPFDHIRCWRNSSGSQPTRSHQSTQIHVLDGFPSRTRQDEIYQNFLRTEFYASFHWVSSAPMQLNDYLAQFLSGHGAPRGSYHMNSFSIQRNHKHHL